ncbi:signal transducing adapter molecule 2-like [Mercenaria mercenaria]|uniref:signal transducing adapter molecule 2-like n=1 Tax=Mercenaria mercenaria TaxID=6596 RepID=UPI00234E776C|nr:signal transducing adapter molecule 2-like [Mercenaria mercenaria]
MPLFTSSSPFDGDVEKATSEMNTVEDWGLIMDICDQVKTKTNGSKDCLRSIVKRLNHRVPFVSMQALTLLNACVNNCGRDFHLEICSRDFVSECRTLIGQKAHPRVAQKLKYIIKSWAEMKEFKEDPALNLVPSFYESLKKEGHEFADPDSTPKKTVTMSKDPNVAQSQQEEDDLAKAIALSLQEEEKGSGHKTTSLYPTGLSAGASGGAAPRVREVRKVRALYDFEAVEDNELTFHAGELISVLDDSDPNWWKGFNQRGEGLFPANFVTADLSVEPEEPKRKVEFSEEVQVKTIEAPEQLEIDEAKIDDMLQQIQNADPTGETRPDSVEMLQLEEQCKAMGPLIDAELEKIDKRHAELCGINAKVLEALQMYHNLMKETPMPFAYKQSMSGYNPGAMGMPPGSMPQQFSGTQYMPQGGMSQMPQMTQGQGQMGSMSQGQGQTGPVPQGQLMQGQGQPQTYTTASSQNFNNSAPVQNLPGQQPGYNAAQSQPQPPHPQQNVVPPQQSIPTHNVNVVPSQSQYGQTMGPVNSQNMVPSTTDYGSQSIQGHMYQQPISQQQLL